MEKEKTVKELALLIRDMVEEKKGGVSFVEIEHLLSQHIEIKGDHCINPSHNDMIVFWACMSAKFTEVMIYAIGNQLIFPHQCSLIIYAVDGKLFDFPLAKKDINYKTEHWLPIVFYTYPSKARQEALKEQNKIKKSKSK